MKTLDRLDLVHVVRQFRPGVGGLETFVDQLSQAQHRDGHRVRVVTLDHVFDSDMGRLPARETLDGIDVVRLPYVGSKRYPFALSVLGALGPAQIVHVHGIDFFADYLALSEPVHRRPMIISTHGGFFHTGFAQRLKRLYFWTITRAALSRFRLVVAVSDDDERMFRRIAGDRVQLIANKVDFAKFAGLADRSSPDLIYFGRIAPNKEIERLLRWFEGLALIDRDCRLIVAGKPMGESLERLAAIATELRIRERVDFHDTPTDEQLRALIARCSAYVCASSYEGFGIAAIEAAAAGLYPVLSAIGPFEAHLAKLGFGSSVAFDQPASWAESYARFASGIAAF
ncbi:MAG: glycosyltransferase family 4 protein, partial [Pseudomonadota bacterium]|nr:glycosyltransferase family 4 protein [Pseudomonadota bacterium]